MCAVTADATAVLQQLYGRQLDSAPDNGYLQEHCAPAFVNGTIQTFRFYEPYLPTSGRILDWGCHHAPDACLIRLHRDDQVELHGCDISTGEQFRVFHEFAGLRYEQLRDTIRLPYPDASFDAVVASGVLEHVPFDYESLKELYRVLKPRGRLIVTYLPNIYSIEEWRLRRIKGNAHVRLYSKYQARNLFLHSGFRPLVLGFQDRLDLLPATGGNYRLSGAALRTMRPFLRLFGVQWMTSCLCAVTEKAGWF